MATFFFVSWSRRWIRRKPLGTAIQTSIGHFNGHEEEVLVNRDITLAAGADQRGEESGVGGIGDVVDIDAVEISLEEVIALESKIGIGESELGNYHLKLFGHFRGIADAELAESLLDFGIVGIGGTKLKGVRLLE